MQIISKDSSKVNGGNYWISGEDIIEVGDADEY